MESEGKAPHTLTLGTKSVISSTLRPLYLLRNSPLCLLPSGLDGPQSRYDGEQINSCPIHKSNIAFTDGVIPVLPFCYGPIEAVK